MSTSPRRPAAWSVVAALGAVLLTAYTAVPEGAVRDLLFCILGAGGAAAVLVGASRRRPGGAVGWHLVAAAVTSWAAGDVLATVLHRLRGEGPVPGAPDVFYLVGYPLLAAALLVLQRRRRCTGERAGHAERDVEGMIDSAILTAGVALVSWVTLVRPGIGAAGGDTLRVVVALAHPVLDLLLLAVLVRLLAAQALRRPAYRLIGLASGAMLLADTASQLGLEGRVLDLLWSAVYVTLGVASLHPSAQEETVHPEHSSGSGRVRLLLLTSATLLAPATLAAQVALGDVVDGGAVALASTVLFLLVVARMNLLVRRLQQQAHELDALARTDQLTGLMNRRSGEALLDALSRTSVATGAGLEVGILDLDRFKVYNDTFGHPAGDRLLVAIARAWGSVLEGTGARLARWGGEEFLLVVPPPRADGVIRSAVALLELMRSVVPEGQSFSAGAAEWDGTETTDSLVARADAALYAAKHAGRARTETAGPRVGTARTAPERVAGGTAARSPSRPAGSGRDDEDPGHLEETGVLGAGSQA